ncbi:type II secretion system major pseudopilin GspG [Denitratimonas sp. CY0512]|uniref:type II secretion system major pseudopilin GspG n=1 Tax=Denitratimonas sp. CY0512 TaxID=3131940 RepID=UPI0030B396FE
MIPSRFPAVNPRRHARGFTLIEILVVVVIIGILAGAVMTNLWGETDRAMQARAKADIDTLKTSLNLYRLDNFVYPSTNQGLEALINRPGGSPEARNWRSGGYIDRIPKDPWGRDYVYLSPGQRGDFDLYSYGADGQPGGEGGNADVTSWGE